MANLLLQNFSPKRNQYSPTKNHEFTMAVNLFQESPISPRISFSHDLHNPSSDHVPRSDQNLLLQHPSPNHFDFDFPSSQLGLETSSADELFSNGIIIPTQMKQTHPDPPPSNDGFRSLLEASRSIPPSNQERKETGEEEITTSTKASSIREEKGNSRSFWRFMRSSSLNFEGSHCKKALIWQSLPLLARSNSTGSSPIKQSHGKLHGTSSSYNYRQLSKPISSSLSSSSGFHQKPPLKKVYGGQVLNVPPPYITKGTSDLLGFGSLFRSSNDKKGKKR